MAPASHLDLRCAYAGQPGAAQDRLAARIDGRKTVTLRGTRNPRVEGLADEGPLDDMSASPA